MFESESEFGSGNKPLALLKRKAVNDTGMTIKCEEPTLRRMLLPDVTVQIFPRVVRSFLAKFTLMSLQDIKWHAAISRRKAFLQH